MTDDFYKLEFDTAKQQQSIGQFPNFQHLCFAILVFFWATILITKTENWKQNLIWSDKYLWWLVFLLLKELQQTKVCQ